VSGPVSSGLWTDDWASSQRHVTLWGMTFRPVLRPGAPLLRRDATHLQVGTSPGIVVPDRPGLVALLRLLDGVRDVPRLSEAARARVPDLDGDVGSILRELCSVGAVVDASRWALPVRGLVDEARHLDLLGIDLTALTRRPRFTLALHPDPSTRPLAHTARAVLADAGLDVHDSGDPDLVIVLSCGEAPRDVFEQLVARAVPHLPVVVDEDRVRLGPLVVPGVSPCVGCHDLHRGDWDRAWPALVPQLGRARVLTPPALGVLARHAAAVELAAEVLAYSDARPTRTAGRCLVIGPHHDDRTTWPIAFHHACGCGLLAAA
jgi:hypothetical protein